MDKYRLYSSLSVDNRPKAEAHIDLSALRHNYNKLCSYLDGCRAICVVKADAYGHGAPECAKALAEAGCDFFAVSSLEEALAIRKVFPYSKKKIDIIILGYTFPEQAKQLSDNNIIQTISSEQYAKRLNECALEAGCRVRTHIALDTGMNRIGFCVHNERQINEAVATIYDMQELRGIEIQGMFTHFADADADFEKREKKTVRQYERFDKVNSRLQKRGFDTGFLHVCNSAATVKFPQFHLDGVRLGIMLYGALPSEYVECDLLPVMTFKTIIAHTHLLSPGEEVSYGGEFSSSVERKIATVPIGYADGFMRSLSGAELCVHTKSGEVFVPVVGRVCMDQCMIDITGTDACEGDVVTVFGDNPDMLHALAVRAKTIEYEILCLISSRVPRIYK
ncbi:MAG: alanine racemase [Ruminococcaceae bacterium]|nr:alanine racemase [Oscillospiraceae bacterium]